MTNVLIPTDFTVNSFRLASQALALLDVNTVNIILFHAFRQPASEFELLIPSRPKPFANLVTEELRQACRQFKEKYPQRVQKICFRFLEGESVPLFRNFIDANEVDLIFCPEEFVPVKVNQYSVDPVPLFKKAGVKLITEYARPKQKRPAENETVSMSLLENFIVQTSS